LQKPQERGTRSFETGNEIKVKGRATRPRTPFDDRADSAATLMNREIPLSYT
jgi:hypothetical protein